MIFYRENLNIPPPTHKCLEPVNKFNQVARYKMNIQKLVASPFTSNPERKLRKQFHAQ